MCTRIEAKTNFHYMKTNYSIETSLPAYRDNQESKQLKKQQILEEIKKSPLGVCLKQLEQALHIPQSTCAGRVNDLIADNEVTYDGVMEFEGRLRKRIIINHCKIQEQGPTGPGQQELKLE